MNAENLFSLDRIEGEAAVLVAEDGTTAAVSLSALPDGAREGKMYRFSGEIYVEDPEAEKERRERIRALQNRLRGRKN